MDDSASSGRTNILKKIIGFLNPSSHEDDVTEEEIISMVNEGHEQGVLRASEAEMIHNIFEFGDKEAKDIMTHRKNLIAIDGELSYNDAVPFIIENNKSRYPVYLEDIDNIIGVLHIKDAFAFAQKNEVFRTSIKDIKGLIREVDFVPAYGYEFSIRKVKDKMIREVLVKKADAKHQRPEDDPLARNGKE